MKLEQSFDVDAPVDAVWQALIDVERVAPCLPGAQITGRNDDGSYDGTFTVKIGPTSAAYAGKLEMETVDESAHTATMRANGTDKRGQGGAKAKIISTVKPGPDGGTHVDVVTDYSITGRLAGFGRGGMIEDISNRLLRDFAQRLQASLTTPGGTAQEPQTNGGKTPTVDEPAAAADTGPDLRTAFTPPPQAEPVQGMSLMFSVLLERARRQAPAIAALAVVVLLLAVLLGRRRR